MHIISNYGKSKKKNPERSQRKSKTKPLPKEEQRQELHLTLCQKPCKQEESRGKYLKCCKKRVTDLEFCTL